MGAAEMQAGSETAQHTTVPAGATNTVPWEDPSPWTDSLLPCSQHKHPTAKLMLASPTFTHFQQEELAAVPRVAAYLERGYAMGVQFLDLPRAVRDAIYLELVQIGPCDFPGPFATDAGCSHIPMQTGLRQKRGLWCARHETEEPIDLRSAVSLLLVCRLISKEATAVLYSCNTWLIRYQAPGDLVPLLRLGHGAINHLRRLRILLNVIPCPYRRIAPDRDPECYDMYPEREASLLSGESLDVANYAGRRVVDDWTAVVQHISPHIDDGVLDLALVCDSQNVETAGQVVQASRALPRLAAFHLRLGRQFDHEISSLAEAAGLASVGIAKPAGPFPYFGLPPELRKAVLEFTDVITPHRQVVWEPRRGFYLQWRVSFCHENCRWGPETGEWCNEAHHACRFRHCHPYASRSSPGCFCRRFHSAYSTRQGACACWQPPTDLFLVDHQFADEARAAFFAENRFIVVREGGFCFPEASACAPYPAVEFLSSIVPRRHRQHLRSLELVFHPFNEYEPHKDAEFHAWARFLQSFRGSGLAGLTLRIVMADYYWWDGEDATDRRERFTRAEASACEESVLAMLAPLRAWAGRELRRVFVWLPDFMARTPEGTRQERQEVMARGKPETNPFSYTFPSRMRPANTRVEQAIMGPAYDASVWGKLQEKQSEWAEKQSNIRCMQ